VISAACRGTPVAPLYRASSSSGAVGKRVAVDELHEHLRALRRLFRRRLDEAAGAPGAERVDLGVVESTVAKAVEDLERASRELEVAETRP
jgi:hypothetical protein